MSLIGRPAKRTTDELRYAELRLFIYTLVNRAIKEAGKIQGDTMTLSFRVRQLINIGLRSAIISGEIRVAEQEALFNQCWDYYETFFKDLFDRLDKKT